VAVRAKPAAARGAKVVGSTSRPRGRDKAPRVIDHPAPAVLETGKGQGTSTAAERVLTRAETADFRQMLLEKRAEILGDVSTLHNEALNKDRRDAAGDLSSMPIHMADLGSDNYELEFTLGLIEGERAILKEIDEALERIQQGVYGLCLATGRPIGKARLRAKPWAKYCYEYTLAQEQGQTRRV
jgi:DnaK suppressor protein